MFPYGKSKRLHGSALGVLILSAQLLFGPWLISGSEARQPAQNLSESTAQEVRQASVEAPIEEAGQNERRRAVVEPEKLSRAVAAPGNLLTQFTDQYGVDPAYVRYIIQVEEIFQLEDCELLALIGQESGFRPKTRMDGGSLSYNTTQMKLATAKTAYMAITEYYHIQVPQPTHEKLEDDPYYAAFLAGGYLRYLNDVYKDPYETLTAYNWGINGRMTYLDKHGDFRSPYALKVTQLQKSIREQLKSDYQTIRKEVENLPIRFEAA